jgi:predicted phosphodiesterase
MPSSSAHEVELLTRAAHYQQLRDRGYRTSEIAQEVGVSERTVRRAFEAARKTATPVGRPLGTSATVYHEAAITASFEVSQLSSPEDIMRERGLAPEAGWQLSSIRAAETHTDGGSVVRLSYTARKTAPPFVLAPATPTRPSRLPRRRRTRSESRLAVVLSDPHGWHVDEGMAQAFANFLAETQPAELIINGDVLDCENISRWKQMHPHIWGVEMQQDIDKAGWFLNLWRSALPGDTRCRLLLGNHDIRIDAKLLEGAPQLFGLRRANAAHERPVMSVPYLLRLDELGWEYVESAHGHYPHTRIELVPNELVVMHGSKTAKQPGAGAAKNLEDRGYSVISGHSHKQALVKKTVHPAPGVQKTIVSVETGHASMNNGHGYAEADTLNSVQGFATVAIYPDNSFDVDLAQYEDGYLRWRGERWTP